MEAKERKLVTVLFCDLVGSTALGERLDPEALRSVQAAYFDRMRASVEQFGGTVEKFIGDAVVAVFGVPQSHEDDAERAVLCGLAMQEALKGLNDTLRPRFGIELMVKIGVNSGEAVVGVDVEALATGDVMNTAARLEQAAEAGVILAGPDTARLTRGSIAYGEIRKIVAKGKSEQVEAHPVLGVATSSGRRRLPLVGRQRELELLTALLERAIAGGGVQVVVVLGEPGIGKSRLAEEFELRVRGRATLLRGAALPYGEAIAWLPIAEVVREEAGILESDAPEAALVKLRGRLEALLPPDEASVLEAQLGSIIGVTSGLAGSGPELIWALRRLLHALAEERPLVLVLDDLHWASETLLEGVQEVVETISAVPLVLVLQGRPELREQIGALLAGVETTVVPLEPLDPGQTRELAGNLIGLGADEIAARAGGNPLFLEELAAMAAEGRGEELPQSLRALIAARLDLLPAEAKRLAQAGAVIGRSFWDGAAIDLSGAGVSALRVLRTRGLVEEEPASTFVGQRQLRFHHTLIRDVAYDSLPKQERSEWHRLAARWLRERTADRPELVVAVAHHLDRAVALAGEVAPLEGPDSSLVEAAIEELLRAGEWAASHGSLVEALAPLRRAVELAGITGRLDLARARLAHTLALAGAVDEAASLAQAVVANGSAGEAGALASLALAQVANERGDGQGIREYGGRSLELARADGLPLVEASALDVLGWADLWTELNAEAEAKWAEAARIALELGDLALAARVLGYQSLAATFRCHLHRAQELADESMRLARDAGSLRALAAAHTASARANEFRGRLDAALAHGREWLRISLELGDPLHAAAACAFGVADPLIRLGRLDEALAAIAEGLEISERMGGSAYESSLRTGRTFVLIEAGRLDEAGEELAAVRATDDETMVVVVAQCEGRLHRAEGLADDAERAWRRGLEALGQEDVLLRVEIQLELARLLAGEGRTKEARALADQVRDTLDGSGAYLFIAQLSDLDASLAGQAATPG